MRFEFARDPAIPVGAWCLEARQRRDVVRVHHGALVEQIGDEGFCFGAWPGEFDTGPLCTSTDRAGTSGLIHDGELVLFAPTHPFGWINLVRVGGDRLYASNSLAFLLRASGVAPRPYVSSYHSHINHVIFRPDEELTVKFTGASVHLLLLDAFRIDTNLRVHRDRRPSAVRFHDFASYRDKVTETLAALAGNATSSTRANPLGLTSTISTGFDSAGSLAMATKAGWQHAVTLVDEQRSDDGTAIATHLGAHVDQVSFDAWKSTGPLPEVPFYTVAGPEARLRFAGLGPIVRQSLMTTGGFGDASWDASTDDVGPRFAQTGSGAPGERSMCEWLLHAGTVSLPVPALGASDFEQFLRLSHSPGMAPWREVGDYDRPIARRLVDERGVPPEALADTKIASAWLRGPLDFCDETRADFDEWLASHRLPLRKAADRIVSSPTERAFQFARRVARHSKTTGRLRHFRKLHPSWPTGRLFHWAHDRIGDRYPSAEFD